MTEWAVYLVIFSLVGFVAAVAGPMLKLNTTIVKLTAQVDHLQTLMKEITDNNSKAHERIWAKSDEHDKRLDEHERRIQRIEDQKEIRP